MDIKFKKEIFNVFKISSEHIMELMDYLEKGDFLKVRFMMADIISDYRTNNSLEKVIYSENDILNHNVIVETISLLENTYSDFMMYIEETEKVNNE